MIALRKVFSLFMVKQNAVYDVEFDRKLSENKDDKINFYNKVRERIKSEDTAPFKVRVGAEEFDIVVQ